MTDWKIRAQINLDVFFLWLFSDFILGIALLLLLQSTERQRDKETQKKIRFFLVSASYCIGSHNAAA